MTQETKDMSYVCQKETLTVIECVFYTGLKKSYLYKLTHLGQIPHFKPFGGKIFFDRKEIDAWLKSARVKTQDEIEREALSYTSGH